jgi:Domain of unknown function (DUF4402)
MRLNDDPLRAGTSIWTRAVPVLALALALSTAPCRAAAVTAPARAVVVTAGQFINSSDLRFGGIVPGTTQGNVILNPTTNLRTFTGGVQALGGVAGAADFSALSNPGQFTSLSINLPNQIFLARAGGGAPTMRVNAFTLFGNGLLAFGTSGMYTFRVGGTLRVGANQPVGNYSATFTVTANFN